MMKLSCAVQTQTWMFIHMLVPSGLKSKLFLSEKIGDNNLCEVFLTGNYRIEAIPVFQIEEEPVKMS